MGKSQNHLDIACLSMGLQVREELNKEAAEEYADAEVTRGAVLPPVVVFCEGGKTWWLADGFHRVAAAKLNGRRTIACDVRQGTRLDALRFALGANVAHGLQRTNADKAKAVRMAYDNRIDLELGEVPAASAVGKLVGVSPHTAEFHLGKLPRWKEATERTGADGKQYSLPPLPTRSAAPVKPGQRAAGPVPVRTASAAAAAPEVPTRPAAGVRPPVKATKPVAVDGPVDARGVVIGPELAVLWNRRAEVAEVAALVSRARVVVKKAQAGNDPLWAEINFSSALAFLDQAYTQIAGAEPWCVCPMCQGLGCKACKGRGLMGEDRFKAVVPRELKEKKGGI